MSTSGSTDLLTGIVRSLIFFKPASGCTLNSPQRVAKKKIQSFKQNFWDSAMALTFEGPNVEKV
jgi:hypothetical protein